MQLIYEKNVINNLMNQVQQKIYPAKTVVNLLILYLPKIQLKCLGKKLSKKMVTS